MKKYVLCVRVNGVEEGIEGYTDLEKVKSVVEELNSDGKQMPITKNTNK